VLKPFKLRDIHGALLSAHAHVESLRAQRLDAGLRSFYEHCHGLSDPQELEMVRQLLVDLLVRRIGVAAAGIWEEHAGCIRLVQGAGSSDGLAALDTLMESGGSPEESSHRVIELAGSPRRSLGLCLEDSWLVSGGSQVNEQALGHLCLALDRTVERLAGL
jgi:hypothetical protein